MGKIKDIIGEKYDRLTVVKFSRTINRNAYWICKCECGNEKEISRKSLVTRHAKSCGCFLKESVRERSTKHGLRRTRIYQVWADMKSRCTNKNNEHYVDYGGRGIGFCNEWQDFINFYNDMRPSFINGHSIDRIDVNGNYNAENCKWSTPKEQVNNRRNNVTVTVGGERLTLSQACERLGIKYSTARYWIGKGLNPQEAIEKCS